MHTTTPPPNNPTADAAPEATDAGKTPPRHILLPRRRAQSLRTALATLSILLLAVLTLAAPASATHRIPFKGSDAGTFSISPLEPPLVQSKDVGTGHATHVGAYQLQGREIINLATFAVTDGAFTLTAVSGDTIFGSYRGSASATSDPDVITYRVEGPVTGGTGRFTGASGSLTWDGIGNLRTDLLTDKVSGWISAP